MMLPNLLKYTRSRPWDTTAYVVQRWVGRQNARIYRYWGLFRTGDDAVVDVRFMIEHQPDFCGGFIIRSPQSSAFTRDRWSRSFLNRHITSEHSELMTWERLAKEPDLLPDLRKITGQSTIDGNEARKLADRMICQTALSQCFTNGKRGLSGTDNTRGPLNALMSTIGQTEWTLSTAVPFTSSEISTGAEIQVYGTSGGHVFPMKITDFHQQEPWRNPSSGNDVSYSYCILDGQVMRDYQTYMDGPHCRECGDRVNGFGNTCDNCGTVSRAGPKFENAEPCAEWVRVLENSRYVELAPRGYWSNG